MIRGVCFQAERFTPADAHAIANAGLDAVRRSFVLEHQLKYGWEHFDPWIAAAKGAGLHILPGFKTDTNGSMKPATPELRRIFARFCQEGIQRYDLKECEVWNEPNLSPHFSITRAATATPFVRVLADVAQVAGDCRIIAGGCTPRGTVHSLKFLKRAYKVGLRDVCDALAFHPYGADAEESWDLVEGIRALMLKNRDRSPLHLTEWGWGTAGGSGLEGTNGRTKTMNGQAVEARRFLECEAKRPITEGWRPASSYWYQWQDEVAVARSWADHAGLLRFDGRPKPALAVFGRHEQGKAA